MWTTAEGVLRSAHAGRGQRRFISSPALQLPPGAEIAEGGVMFAGERAIVAWGVTTGGVGLATRQTPLADWETYVVAAESTSAPRAAITDDGAAGAVWLGQDRVPVLARRLPGAQWSLATLAATAADAPDLQINRRGALLVQWTPAPNSAVGGAYHPANRNRWIPTSADRGRGFLRRNQVDWIDAARERTRAGLPSGAADSLRVTHVDERGDVFATVRDPQVGSLSLVRRRAGAARPWRVAAVAAIGAGRSRVVANARGDLVVAFLTPSEFVPGADNSGIATTSPGVAVRGPRRVERRGRVPLRVVVPDSGTLTLTLRPARGQILRNRTVARRSPLIYIRAPRRAGTYLINLTLRTPDGRRYLGRHLIRVR